MSGNARKYLYLSEKWHCKTWVSGGDIPIKLASTYLSNNREGIMTPDENLIHRSEFPIPALKMFGFEMHDVKGVNMSGNYYNGMRIPDITNGMYYKEDGLILSFCNVFDPEIAKKLGKVACVEILDINNLARVINKRLKCKSVAGNCKYTRGHERDHFLKSFEDAWQQEYRLFWRANKNRAVRLPSGLARIVEL
ncbi:hypothetical protein D3C80_742980 [compost metagenome]